MSDVIDNKNRKSKLVKECAGPRKNGGWDERRGLRRVPTSARDSKTAIEN